MIEILSNLKFAIFLLLLIAIISAVGTIIEQNRPLEFYVKAYPETNILINWKLIIALQFNNIFQAGWYFFLIFLLSSSLITCTLRTQYPIFRTSRKYTFFTSFQSLKLQSAKQEIPRSALTYILQNLFTKNYYIFLKKNTIYIHKGLASKIAPIAIHISLILLILGTATSALTGYISQEMVVNGEIFHLQNISTYGILSKFPQQFVGRINDFWITYDENNTVSQFYSDISILDNQYTEKKRQTIAVNYPLRYKNTTIYQTDWNLIGLSCKLDNKFLVQIPLNKINTLNKQTLWTGSLQEDQKLFFSFIVQDLNNILLYNSKGEFIQNIKPSEKIIFNNHEIQIVNLIRATGIQIKQDPGLNFVYTGFFFLILSAVMNILSYSEIWIFRTMDSIHIASKNSKDLLAANKLLLDLVKNFYLKSNSFI
uniref:c-type cytochrome biogenensis protein n=1 Tax=Stylonema alsidii TaxID=35155 RepID=UPI001FCD151C|nr:c-type cytochrome biogenensis protein [Stylonema alsidii]UNJ15196.1 c-type cytochrome biogenensis protein [Stylonema alsidii]